MTDDLSRPWEYNENGMSPEPDDAEACPTCGGSEWTLTFPEMCKECFTMRVLHDDEPFRQALDREWLQKSYYAYLLGYLES